MTISEIVAALLDGWNEKIEFAVRIRLHGRACDPRHCEACPSVVERRTEVRRQPPLVTQLLEARWASPVVARDCEVQAIGKPKSKPPGNLVRTDELIGDVWRIAQELEAEWRLGPEGGGLEMRSMAGTRALRALAAYEGHADPLARRDACEALWRPYRRIRVMLGYDNDWIDIAGSTCGACEGGVLRVERGQPTVVECKACSVRYPWQSWVAMLEATA